MVIGGLYLTKCFWLLYPIKEMAIDGLYVHSFPQQALAAWWVAFYNKKYNCNIIIIPENTYIVILEEDEFLKKVLDYKGNVGWIEICEPNNNMFALIQ